MQFVHRQQRRGLAIVVSDLFDPTGYQNGLDRLRHHKYEPHVVHVYDKSEAEPTMLGDVELIDVETDQANKITVTEKAPQVVPPRLRRIPGRRSRLLPRLRSGVHEDDDRRPL